MTEGLTQESLAGIDPLRKLTVDNLQPVVKHRSAALVEPDVPDRPRHPRLWAQRRDQPHHPLLPIRHRCERGTSSRVRRAGVQPGHIGALIQRLAVPPLILQPGLRVLHAVGDRPSQLVQPVIRVAGDAAGQLIHPWVTGPQPVAASYGAVGTSTLLIVLVVRMAATLTPAYDPSTGPPTCNGYLDGHAEHDTGR